jgi:hypothetical protein
MPLLIVDTILVIFALMPLFVVHTLSFIFLEFMNNRIFSKQELFLSWNCGSKDLRRMYSHRFSVLTRFICRD